MGQTAAEWLLGAASRAGAIVITMDIYEVELCHRGRWGQQDARIVAARNADEAAYKVTGKLLRSEGERRKIRLRVRRLGNGSPPPKLFYAG
jgi:hypothetical protein